MLPAIWSALDHAVVQLIGGAIVAWFLSEQWQRWRQRREFQYQTMVTFAELTGQLVGDYAHIVAGRQVVAGTPSIIADQLRDLGMRTSDHLVRLLSLDAQMLGVFEKYGQALFTELLGLRDILSEVRALTIGGAAPPTPEAYVALQARFTQKRRIMFTMMLREMTFISEEERRLLLASIEKESARIGA